MPSKYWLSLFVVIIHLACEDSQVTPSDERLGLHYFPIEVGNYRIYDIDEINFALVGTDTSSYQLRETVTDSTLLSSGDVQYEILREVREDSTQVWESDSVWTVRTNQQRTIVVENNVSFVKLVFPIENELNWDGNAYNIRQPDFYRYERFDIDTTINNEVYSDLWMVVQSDLGQDILGRNDRFEVYAPNVGLIIKSSIIWNFCQTDCSSENQVVAGRELQQSLIAYGQED